MVSPGLLQAYAAIGVSAVLPIYFGSRASLKMPKSAKHALRDLDPKKAEEEEEDESEELERLTAQEAWLFPVFGSLTLIGLFLAFKYLDKALINKILSSYFALLGTAGLATTSVYAARGCMSSERYAKLNKYKLQLTRNAEEYFSLAFTDLHLVFSLVAVAVSGYHLYTNNWIAANVVALSFSFNAISMLRLDSFKTGTILLSGLFLYDIYWVFFSKKQFGQSVMVAVATNFEAPIKIVYPKDIFADKADFTMLGLGDIVIPGIFVSLAARFDYTQAVLRTLKAGRVSDLPTVRGAHPKPYFTAVLLSYIAGLATTIVVMHTFRAAQPALLYLSPACILSVILTAAVRGEINTLWSYEDGEHDKSTETEVEKKEQ